MKNKIRATTMKLAVAAIAVLVSLPIVAQGPGRSDRFAPVVTGLDAYAVDHNGQYPFHRNPGDTTYNYYMPDVLTSPTTYLEPHQLIDPFATGQKYNRYGYFQSSSFSTSSNYQNILSAHGAWGMWSLGPARGSGPVPTSVTRPTLYDPTNGTISAGVIFRSQRMQKETGAH